MNLREILAHAADSRDGLNATDLANINDELQGLDATLGIRYTHVASGKVTAELPVAQHLLQPVGLVNGGVYCALAESVGSLAGMVMAGGPVVGVNNNTDFISSVRAGVISAEATPLQTGRRTQLWQILMTHRGELVARTTLRTMLMTGK